MARTQLVDLVSINTIYQNLVSNIDYQVQTLNSTITSKASSLNNSITNLNTTLSKAISDGDTKLQTQITNNDTDISKLSSSKAGRSEENTFSNKNTFNSTVSLGSSATLTVSNTTDSTSTSSGGAVTVKGGLAVAKTIYANSVHASANQIYSGTKTIETLIADAVNTTFKYKGQKNTTDDLPSSGNTVGDVWDVKANGHNYVWSSSKTWDDLGDNSIDLNAFTGTENITTLGTITTGTWRGSVIAKDYHYDPSTDITTSGTVGSSSTSTSNLGYSGTFTIPSFNYDSLGHITKVGTGTTYKLPASDNTWRNVKVNSASTDSLGTGTGTGALNFLDGTNTKATYDTANKGIKYNVATGSTSALGVLSVGDNITVDSGKISLTSSNVTGALGYTPVKPDAIATSSTLGLVKPAKSYTKSISTSTLSSTSGRYYAVEIDKDGKLFVNVPWTDTDTQRAIKVNSRDVIGDSTKISLNFKDGTYTTASVNSSGDIYFDVASLNADLITSGTLAKDRHYAPTSESSSTLSSGVINTSTPTITWTTDSSTPYSLVTGLTLNRDSKGHVTGLNVSTANFPKLTSITQLGTITSNLNVSGVASFTNATASTSTTTGAVKISGGLGVVGNIYGGSVYNAVWNDIADCIEVDCELEAGYCYSFDGEHYYKSNEYMDMGCIGIHSDTAGFHVGKKGGNEMEVAIGGFVLAYVDKEYKVGTPLTCTKDGMLTEIKLADKRDYPERVLATYWKSEPNEEWGSDTKKVNVNGRKWVKIK